MSLGEMVVFLESIKHPFKRQYLDAWNVHLAVTNFEHRYRPGD